MAKRPQRATRQTSQHPPARPAYAQRAAKVAAEDKLASSRRQAEFDDEDFDDEEAAPPRKDSRSTVTGKRKRVKFEDRGYGEEQRGSSEMDVDEAEGGGAHSVIDLESEEGDGEGEVDEESEHEDSDKQEEEEGFEIQEREARIPRRDPDLEIADPGPRMKAGERTRFYAKVALPRVEVERSSDGGKMPILEEEEEDVRMPTHPPVILARVDLSMLQMPGCGHTASELDLAHFAMGARVLPLLKQWAFMWRNPDDKSNEFRQLLRERFPSDKKPWNQEVSLVAQIATHKGKYGQAAELLHRMASFSRRLVNANNSRNDFDFFTRFGQQGWASDAPYKFAARLLLAVWEDIETNRQGFFGWLFHEQCELSRPNRPEVRHAYLGWYKLDESLYSSVPTPNLPAPLPAPIVMPVFIPAIQFPADTKPVKSENKEGKAGGKKPVPAEKPYATGEI